MDLVTGALGKLPSKLLKLLNDEYKLQTGVKDQIRRLTRELESMHAALRKVARVPPDELDKLVLFWARDVREASYDMEDILDTFLVRVDGDPKEPPDANKVKRLVKKMGDLFSLSKGKARHEGASTIDALSKQLEEVALVRGRYTADDIVGIPAARTSIDPRLSALYTKVSQLVGIDEQINKLIEMLTKGDHDMKTNQETKIVSVVGFGGLGKTTLVKVVYEKLTMNIPYKAFVPVGQTPDLKKVLRDILVCLDKDHYMMAFNFNIVGERELIDETRKFLKDKRYFIVIDDIWDTESWKMIRSALVDNSLGSKIIITTRKHDVANEAGWSYELTPLSPESSKILFYRRIFHSESKVPLQFSEVSEKILNKCGGVPLAILTTSSLLANKPRNPKVWNEVCDSIGSELGSNHNMDNMRKILSLSYYDLPPHLKTCLLYLSTFPEDYKIHKEHLIWRWIAEDFIQHEEETQCLFEIGESYFNELQNRSLIQVAGMDPDGTSWSCRVHDMVLELICSLSRQENFVTTVLGGGRQRSPPSGNKKVRWLALHNITEEHGFVYGTHQKLRSLIAIGCPMYTIPPVSSSSLLRVLDLESCGSMEGYDLRHLGKLLHLRLIGLRNTFIRKLPEEIGHLMFLQTLDLEGSGVEELPASMDALTGLMCLTADWTTRVPDWIGKLTSLQQMVIYPGYGDDENTAGWSVKELGNLGELRVLRVLIKARDEWQMRDLLESLSKMRKIEVIHLDCYGVQLNDTGVLLGPTGFSLSETLRSLELCWLEFSRQPPWINPQDLPSLCRLWLMVSDVEDQDLEILGAFPGLRHLHLQTVNTERGVVISSGFPSLISCCVTKPLEFVQGAMPMLKNLAFDFNARVLTDDACHNVYFDFGLENLPSLRQVIVQINCQAASPVEVRKAEAGVRDAIQSHPQRPTLEISLFGQGMETLDAVSRNLENTNEPRDELIRKLLGVDDDTHNKKMKILSILRSEGLGKTTLAQEVFDRLSPHFDCGVFVEVGHNANLRKVLMDILISLDRQKYKDFPMTALDLIELIGLLRKYLINKRFFVVIDDIWDLKAWDIIKCALIENSNGSAVLTTSREAIITEVIGGSKESLPPLSLTASKRLFVKKLFRLEDKCPPELENICDKLIETCCGIQTVIMETLELLKSVPRTLKGWQEVYDRRKLAISYNDLDDSLKDCLLYFSMFPKGYEIRGELLIRAWIAEGFVQGTDEQTLQQVDNYLNELVKGKMIEAVEVDAAGKALSCRVYDLVHEFIISKSTEANFAAILKDSQDRALPDTVHRLSIQGNTDIHTRPKALLSQAKSLVVSCDTLPPVPEFPDLHVMDLGGCDSMQAAQLKGIINKSTCLRYLVIGSKCISDIPKDITKVKLLQTLDLSASGLNELPECVLLLKTLECLWVNSHMKIPDGIAKMLALQELGDINITKPELLKKLRQLSKLRVLRIAIWSWEDDEDLKSSVKQLVDNLRSLVQCRKNIQSLSILTCCSLDFMDGMGDKWAPQSLQKLEIRHSAFDKLPSWFDSLLNISSLTIEIYKLSQEIIDRLGKLPTLCSLSLASKEVPEGYFVIGSDEFKKLECLKFASNAMKEMFARPHEATQQLKRLTIVFQASRTEDINKDFSFGLENLCSLEHIRVEIVCFSASRRMVNNAEAAIQKAISREGSSHPNLEIRRLDEESMIADEVDLRDIEQEQEERKWREKKSSSKKIRVTGKIFRQKKRKDLLEHIRPFLDSTAQPQHGASHAS